MADPRHANMHGRRPAGIWDLPYRVGYLIVLELTPAPTELTEKLEQLRALWHGDAIVVCDARRFQAQG
ncbi:MAG: hypothetical protein CM1200mP18_20150 [Gammaproteobacteria bacterium]|nr:MAG: hypothetical protein CM1200mP18_20150 [Gammaproteobacteria bacterium]